MLIENWLINEDGICWNNQKYGDIDYFIDNDSLLHLRNEVSGEVYEWLIHLAKKTWITKLDIFSLNSAFIFSINKFHLTFDLNIFNNTLIEQIKEINKKTK